jgi:chromosome segregation ATPase
MNEQQERVGRLKKEREEIAARVAKFRATQARFAREREEHFTKTWQRVRTDEPISWS